MLTRRFGWRSPEALGRSHVGRATSLRDLDTLPLSVEIADLPEVYDQGAVGSCTAQALVGACEILAHRAGYAPERPSRRALYWRERSVEGSVAEDAGAILADGVEALRVGWIDEARWPHATAWDASWIAAPPPPGEFSPRLINAEALVIDARDVAWEIACGHPVAVGLRVTRAWEDLDGDTLPGPEGDSIGGHAVTLVGFDRGERRSFLVRNSWGSAWGDGGYAWLPFSWISLGVCGEAFSLRAIRRAR